MTRIRAILMAGLAALLMTAPLSAEPYLLDDPGARELSRGELAAEPGRFAFPPGERLVYSVRYWGMPVATASLEVVRFLEWEGRRYAHVVGIGDTNSVFSAFYPIHDRTEAWIDLDTLRTHRTATHTRHGHDKETHERVEYEWDAHFLHMVEVKHHAKRRREVGFDFGPFVHDTFEAFYAIRTLPLEVGSTAQLPVYANRKIYGLEIEVARRGELKWNGEKVETLVVKPRGLLDGAALGNGRGELHVRADGRRVPLRMNGWFETTGGFKIGGVKADLVSWHPGDGGFVAEETPPTSPAVLSIETRRGKPIWTVPDAVKQTRRERGLTAYSRKIPLGGNPNPAR